MCLFPYLHWPHLLWEHFLGHICMPLEAHVDDHLTRDLKTCQLVWQVTSLLYCSCKQGPPHGCPDIPVGTWTPKKHQADICFPCLRTTKKYQADICFPCLRSTDIWFIDIDFCLCFICCLPPYPIWCYQIHPWDDLSQSSHPQWCSSPDI